jgi:hypothetical protein
MDMDGNLLSSINDVNDLFGYKIPGDKNTISVIPPTRTNVFRDLKNKPDVAGAAQRKAHMGLLEAQYGAPAQGTSRQKSAMQMGQAINNYNPKAELRHYGRAAGNAANLGLLGSLMTEENGR